MDNVINPHEVGRIIIDKDKKLVVPNAGEALDGPSDHSLWMGPLQRRRRGGENNSNLEF